MTPAQKYPQIGVRVRPEFRAELGEMADRYHEGSESSVLREGARLYIALRRRFGPNYEPTIHALLNDPERGENAA